jgi:carbon-monoxide dehydrogenase medium subunit
MILPRFDVLTPKSVAEACALLAEHAADGVRILAGGTDLLVDLRRPIIRQHVPRCDGCPTHPEGAVHSTIDCAMWEAEPLMASGGSLRAALRPGEEKPPAYLISLHKIKDLRGLHQLPDGRLRVGACTTITEIERSTVIRENWTALAEGADNLGSPLVRNRGTLGGNIANARPAADAAVPTIGLDALLTLQGTGGTRQIPARDFPVGPGKTIIRPDEILTHIEYPAPGAHAGSAYYKLANRKALEISTVGVAGYLAVEEPGGPVGAVTVALGAVGPTPSVAESVNGVLLGKIPDDSLIAEAASAAAQDTRPIDDHRGSAWYRVQMVEVITRRVLTTALQRAKGEP